MIEQVEQLCGRAPILEKNPYMSGENSMNNNKKNAITAVCREESWTLTAVTHSIMRIISIMPHITTANMLTNAPLSSTDGRITEMTLPQERSSAFAIIDNVLTAVFRFMYFWILSHLR